MNYIRLFNTLKPSYSISIAYIVSQWLVQNINHTMDDYSKQTCHKEQAMTWQWAQVEWWLEHRHGRLVKRQWAGSILGWVARDEYQVLGSTTIPARLDTLIYWEPFSWLTSVGTTRNAVIRLGWSRIGLAVLILHAAGVGLQSSAVSIINTTHFSYRTTTHTCRHCNTHTNSCKHNYAELVMGMIMGFEAVYAGRGRRNPVWSCKEPHSLRGLIVKSVEHCGADYKPLDRHGCLNRFNLFVQCCTIFKRLS